MTTNFTPAPKAPPTECDIPNDAVGEVFEEVISGTAISTRGFKFYDSRARPGDKLYLAVKAPAASSSTAKRTEVGDRKDCRLNGGVCECTRAMLHRCANGVDPQDSTSITYTVDGVVMSPLEYIDHLHTKLQETARDRSHAIRYRLLIAGIGNNKTGDRVATWQERIGAPADANAETYTDVAEDMQAEIDDLPFELIRRVSEDAAALTDPGNIASAFQEYIYRVVSQVSFEHAQWANERGAALMAQLKALANFPEEAAVEGPSDTDRLDLLEAQTVEAIHMNNGKIIDVRGQHSCRLREAIDQFIDDQSAPQADKHE